MNGATSAAFTLPARRRIRRWPAAFAMLAMCAALAACDNPEQREAKYLRRGTALFDKGDYAKARLEFRNALAIKPTDAEAYYRLGLTDEAQRDLLNAFGNFVHAEEQQKHYLPAMLKISEYYMRAGHLDEAQKRLDIILSEHPDDAEGHALQAAVFMRRQQLDKAESEARSALARDRKNVDATQVLAEIDLQRNDRAAAMAALADGLAENPNSILLLIQKANLHLSAGEDDKAEAALKSLIDLRPAEIEFRAKLSALLARHDRREDAEAVWRAGVAASPNDWEMKHQLALFLDRSEGLSPAEAEIKGYIAKAPKNDFLYFWLSDLYVSHKASDQAISLLEQVVERERFEPEGLNARNSLARIRFALGDRSLAEKLLSVILDQDPSNHDALLLRASLSYDQEDYSGAVADLRQLLRTAPKDEQALRLLGETFLRQHRINLAADTLNQLAIIAPKDFSAKVRLAQIVHLSGDDQQARKLLGEVTADGPDYPIGWETMVRVAIDQKDWKEADAGLEKLEALPNQKDTATFLRAQIADRKGNAAAALQLYQEVATAAPDSPIADHAYVEMTRVAAAAGKLDSAASFIAAAKSRSATARLTLASIYLEQKKNDAAAEQFDSLIAEKVALPDVYRGRAEIFKQAGQKQQALATLKQGSEILPGDMALCLTLAHDYVDAGQYSDAIAALQAYLVRDPSADLVANDLAAFIADHAYDSPDSLETARRAADRFQTSTDPHRLDTVAWVYYRLDHIRDASVLMERAAHAGPLTPVMHYHYGAILLKAGQKDKAKAELTSATKPPAPPFDGFDNAKDLLKMLQ